jgi:hypothetical protein
MSKIYKNWPVHNLIGHPVSELVYWVIRPLGKSKAKRVGDWIHDSTLPAGHTADGHAGEQGKCK